MLTLRTAKPLMTAAALALAAATMSACGVKGPLEPPGGQAATASGEVRSPEAADAGSNSAAPQKKHDTFILDPLLR
jgi:predicted small lipoprotein YifL